MNFDPSGRQRGAHGDDDHFPARSDERVDRGADQTGDYASTSDYVRDLVRRDRERRTYPELTFEDLRRIVDEARASGSSRRKVPDILARARTHAQGDQPLDE